MSHGCCSLEFRPFSGVAGRSPEPATQRSLTPGFRNVIAVTLSKIGLKKFFGRIQNVLTAAARKTGT
jgi:hypothetical protein